ncbi:MAG: 16S rRNA (adenine(1518)-N(6)/adenine(1519)-N(6))-dimethyltransferase RsmA [Nitrospiraceae bacterium]
MASSPPVLKRLGQHFLIDHNIVRKMLSLADLHVEDTVLEIGPGRGVLTAPLCAAARRVIALEIDSKLYQYLGEILRDCRNLELWRGDALEYAYDQLPYGTVIVANLPYYVSTPILFKLLDAHDRIDRMILMLQSEVAQRMVAQPGAREYGVLSVQTQYAAEVTLGFHVSLQCFRPRPEVASAVVRLHMRRRRRLPSTDEALFTRIVRASFAHRRKTLANSLRDEGWAANAIGAALSSVGIAPTRRAESLTVEEFIALVSTIKQLNTQRS